MLDTWNYSCIAPSHIFLVLTAFLRSVSHSDPFALSYWNTVNKQHGMIFIQTSVSDYDLFLPQRWHNFGSRDADLAVARTDLCCKQY